MLYLSINLVILCLIALIPRPVWAHGVELLRSDPPVGAVLTAPPKRVTAWFNEELQSGESTLKVFDKDGMQVDQGNGGVDLNDPQHASLVVDLPVLAEGAYRVEWRAVLLDGDASDGEFTFYVGALAATKSATGMQSGDLPGSSPGVSRGWMFAIATILVIGLTGGIMLRFRKQRTSR